MNYALIKDRIHLIGGTADADMEFPDCMQCKNCCNDHLCEKCGPEYGFPLAEVLKPGQKVEFYKDEKLYYCEVMGINIQNKKLLISSNWSFSELPLNAYGRLWWIPESKEELKS